MIVVALLIVSCSNNPVFEPQEHLIKSQTKWLVDNRSESKIAKISYKEYDRQGNLMIDELYNTEGRLIYRKNLTMTGNLQVVEIIRFDENGNKTVSRNIDFLNDQGFVQERITLSSNGDTTAVSKYTYFDNGKIKEEFRYDSGGNLIKKVEYSYNYDNNGYVTGRMVNDHLNSLFNSRDSIVYHLDVRQVDRIVYNSSGEKGLTYTYYYDNAGKILKEINTDSSGAILRKYIYEYVYY